MTVVFDVRRFCYANRACCRRGACVSGVSFCPVRGFVCFGWHCAVICRANTNILFKSEADRWEFHTKVAKELKDLGLELTEIETARSSLDRNMIRTTSGWQLRRNLVALELGIVADYLDKLAGISTTAPPTGMRVPASCYC